MWYQCNTVVKISIHALLAESDGRISAGPRALYYFYPRSPCGERRYQQTAYYFYVHFYPRSPCGERRAGRGHVAGGHQISIHALLAESDDTSKDVIKTTANFYPRSPCGERR